MKVSTPVDMQADLSQLESAISKFEAEFKKEEKGLKYYSIAIDGELGIDMCKAVEKEYQRVGWIAKCQICSLAGRKTGLTGLVLQLK